MYKSNPEYVRFYSYVDMLNDEKLAQANNTPTSRPPMKSQAYSCPFILKRSPPQAYSSSSATTTFSNPFIKTTELPASSPYVSPQQSARRYSNNANNNAKSPKNRSSSILFQRQSILSNVDPVANMHKNPKFQIESSDSEEEDLTDGEAVDPPSVAWSCVQVQTWQVIPN
ncbi:BTE_HP_G0039320.mRNA.1.CDS.1 [Saccharomyces cerevisiae]|nr:BTE_HP_G0039320.mRNA.1.CDS.1 [Saccharomyces cerevisiae]CAI6789554.1 BTE_HP_G0039320.mRNA.1.CDS.1 [Saccharomyces cerevisiae]